MKIKRILVLTLGLVAAAVTVYAHPPSDFKIGYDSHTKVLSVEVIHKVKNSAKHFIDDVNIYLNNKIAVKQVFKSQTDKEMQKGIYLIIDASPGDEIKVEADCNFVGKGKKVFKVSVENIKDEKNDK